MSEINNKNKSRIGKKYSIKIKKEDISKLLQFVREKEKEKEDLKND